MHGDDYDVDDVDVGEDVGIGSYVEAAMRCLCSRYLCLYRCWRCRGQPGVAAGAAAARGALSQ